MGNKMSRARLLEDPQEEEVEEEEEVGGKEEGEDLVTDTMGQFGRYQIWVCLLGFLLTVVHSWLSLSLKFVGLAPEFRCGEGEPGPDRCTAYTANTTRPCNVFVFDQEEVRHTIVERWGLVCSKAGLENVAQSVFFAGCLVGVFLAGLLADYLGRKVVVVVLVLVMMVTGVAGGLVSSWPLWLVLRFTVGAASIGMISVRYTIQVELVGGRWRTWANTFSGSGWVVGYMSLPVLAYTVQDMRRMEMLLGLALLPLLLLLVFCHPESPRWLLAAGKLEAAAAVINRVAGWNKPGRAAVRMEQLTKFYEAQLEAVSRSPARTARSPGRAGESSSLATLFTSNSYPRTRRNLLTMSACWFAFGMGYFGLALHTPELGSSVFLVFFIGGLMDVPVMVLGPLLLNRAGRQPCMVGGLLLGAGCLLATFLLPPTSQAVILLAVLGKCGLGLAFDTGYVWTSEMFPTVIRNSALSACSSAARLGAILAPLVVLCDSVRPGLSLLLYGVTALLAGVAARLLRPETRTVLALPDSLQEGEAAAGGQ